MNKTAVQLALREWKAEFSRPATWIVLVAVGLILSVVGAFDTDQVLRPVPRALYWVGVVSATYALGSFLSLTIRHALDNQPRPLRLAAMALASGCVLTLCILGINTALFGWFFRSSAELYSFVATVFGVVLIVVIVFDWVLTQAEQNQTEQSLPPEPKSPAILTRLPLDKRGQLISLTALDHYVEVTTDKGTELVLMRLGDAVGETPPIVGVQIHRSHWVALDQITKVEKQSNKTTLITSDKRELPISRSGLPRLKEHGVLPS